MMDRKQRKDVLITAGVILLLLILSSFLLRSCSDRKAERAEQKARTEMTTQKEEITEEDEQDQSDQEDNKLEDLDGNKIEENVVPKEGVQ